MSIGTEEVPPIVPPVAEPEANPFSRIAGVLLTPVRTFAEIARRPDILVPLVLIIVIGYGATFAIMPRVDMDAMMDQQFQQAKKQNPNMSQEDFERMSKFGKAMGKGIAFVQPVLMVVWYVIVAGILLLGVRLFGGEGDFKQAFSVTLYAWIPYVILSIITAIVVVAKGSFDPMAAATIVKSNPAFLVPMKEQFVLYSLLSMLDVFTFWVLGLLIVGFASVSKLSKGKTAAIVIPMWLVLVLIRLGFAAMGAAKMKG
jgi:hypothetical protein